MGDSCTSPAGVGPDGSIGDAEPEGVHPFGGGTCWAGGDTREGHADTHDGGGGTEEAAGTAAVTVMVGDHKRRRLEVRSCQ